MNKKAYIRQSKLYAGSYGVSPGELESLKRSSQYRSVTHAFELQVARDPENLAIKDGDHEISFADLNKAGNQAARTILQECSPGGNRVALLLEHSAASILGIIAVLKTGNVFVPLDPVFPEDRLAFSILDSQARVLVSNSKNLPLARRLVAEGIKIINLDEIDADLSDDNLGIDVTPDTLASIYYTSGSTGQSKGILKDHRSLLYLPSDYLPGDRQSHLYSFGFRASAGYLLPALLSGIPLYPFDVKSQGLNELVQWLAREKITILNPPTSLLRQIFGILDEDEFFPNIRRINLGGQAVYRKDVERIQKHCPSDSVVRISLASTETGKIAQFLLDSDTVIEDEILPSGYPIPEKDVLILDEEGQPLGFDEVGEIAVRSRYIFRSYWNRLDLMEERIRADPEGGAERVFLTGDIGVIRPDGLLEHRGRKDFLVKIRGYRVEIADIESKLRNLEHIAQAAVVAHDNQKSGEKYLAAYLVASNDVKPSIRSLREGLARSLPDFMIPARFVFMDELPKTPSGKVDRNSLPVPDTTRSSLDIAYQAPQDNLEKQLAEVWEQVLEIDLVGIDDDFFDLGGSSLQAMQLFVEIEKIGGRKMPLAILLEASTIRQQAVILREKGFIPDWSPIIVVQTQGSKPPLFCLAGKGGNPLRFRQLAKRLGEERPIYFLQSRGLNGIEKPYDNVEEIAADFLAEIQKVQPEGPYFLCGSSFGGLVAFEIAQQLLSQDEEVGLVALLDTYAPSYLKKNTKTTRVIGTINGYGAYIRKQIENLITSDWESKRANFQYYLEMLPKVYKSSWQKLRMKLEDLRFRSIPPELKKVESANIRASRNYLPQSYPEKMVLLRATRLPRGAPPDPLLGWGDMDIGELIVHDVDSYHGNILFEPAVKSVAEFLRGHLGE